MSKPLKTVLYVCAIVLLIAVPVVIRHAGSEVAEPPAELALPPGLPAASAPGFEGAPDSEMPPVSPPPRRNIRNPAPEAFPPADSTDGPPEDVRLRAMQEQVPVDEIVYGFVRRLLAEDGDAAIAHAQRMLADDDVRMRAMGVVTLLEASGGDLSQLAPLLDADDVPSALWAAGWLYDNGMGDSADEIVENLTAKELSLFDFHTLLESRSLGGSAGRAALRLLSDMAGTQVLEEEYAWVTQQQALPYSVRMMAAVFLGETLEPTDHLYRVRGLANLASPDIEAMMRPRELPSKAGALPATPVETPPDLPPETPAESASDEPPSPEDSDESPVDPLWAAGLVKLAAELKVPGNVEQSPLSRISPFDIQRAGSQQSPSALEDLALRLEYLTGLDDPVVYAGTADALAGLVAGLPDAPVSETLDIARNRLEALAPVVEALEDPNLPDENVPPGVSLP